MCIRVYTYAVEFYCGTNVTHKVIHTRTRTHIHVHVCFFYFFYFQICLVSWLSQKLKGVFTCFRSGDISILNFRMWVEFDHSRLSDWLGAGLVWKLVPEIVGEYFGFVSLRPSVLDLLRDKHLSVDNSWASFQFFMIISETETLMELMELSLVVDFWNLHTHTHTWGLVWNNVSRIVLFLFVIYYCCLTKCIECSRETKCS